MLSSLRVPPQSSHTLDTASGEKLDLDDPRPETIHLADIAGALSRVCRFGAQATRFYSVAQHAVMVRDIVEQAGRPDLAAVALHHDSAEAFVCDLPKPLKNLMEDEGDFAYDCVSKRLDRTIGIALGVDSYDKGSQDGEVIKLADERALLIEAEHLLPDGGRGIREARSPEWLERVEALPKPRLLPLLSPEDAQDRFLQSHHQVVAGRRAQPHGDRVSQLDALYEEIHARYSSSDPELVRRITVPRVLESRVLLLAQALGRDTQRLSGLPYCFSPAERPTLSKGGQVLDAFLWRFGHTIDANGCGRYAYHTDIAHYYPGRKPDGSGDREPDPEEIEFGENCLERELGVIEPNVVVLLGKAAAKLFLRTYGAQRVKRLRDVLGEQQACRVGGREVTAFAVHHPSSAWRFADSGPTYERVASQIRRLL